MVYDATVTVGSAITLGAAVLGSGKRIGGTGRSAEEFVLKQNTNYVFLVTNQTAGATNETNFFLNWYEHQDKN